MSDGSQQIPASLDRLRVQIVDVKQRIDVLINEEKDIRSRRLDLGQQLCNLQEQLKEHTTELLS